jgi:hypothetical protein
MRVPWRPLATLATWRPGDLATTGDPGDLATCARLRWRAGASALVLTLARFLEISLDCWVQQRWVLGQQVLAHPKWC